MLYWSFGSLTAAAVAYLTYKTKALTPLASLLAAVIILYSHVFGGWFGLIFLLFAYSTIALIDRLLKGHKKDDVSKKQGPRDIFQVGANGLPATVCVLLYYFTGKWAFMIGFTVALTEALADSVASDVGVFSKKEPVSICRFRKVPRGLSGGISLLGSGASFAATVLCGAMYLLFFRDLWSAALVILFGNLGCLLDSVLGDLLQEKFRCPQCGALTEKHRHCQMPTQRVAGIPHLDNCLVNLISNTLSAAAAVLVTIW